MPSARDPMTFLIKLLGRATKYTLPDPSKEIIERSDHSNKYKEASGQQKKQLGLIVLRESDEYAFTKAVPCSVCTSQEIECRE